MIDPYDAWEPWPVTVVLSDGPDTRPCTDPPAELPTSGRVGFTHDLYGRTDHAGEPPHH